jgi:putative ABC transport system ATP-binding protein
VEALRGVNLTVVAGEMVAVMGPSGSGKSTLLHLLGCLDAPTRGRYFFAGADVTGMEDEELSLVRSLKISFVFQTFNLIPQSTVLENVILPFQYRPGGSAGAREKAERALEKVGLAHRMTHRPMELSGGEMQRVAIARAIAQSPLVLLADEPTGNLDSSTGNSILELFEFLRAEGVTIIMVTHDPGVARRCERILEMRDGRMR